MMTYRGLKKAVSFAIAVLALCAFVSACGGAKTGQERREADTLLSLGKIKEAGELYAKARIADPSDALALVGQGKCLAAEGKMEEALKQFQQVIAESPRIDDAYWEAADALTMLGRPGEALDLAKQYSAINPEQATLLQGQALLLSGKPADASTLLESVANNTSDAVPVRILLALAEFAQGNTETAEAGLRDVLTTPDTSATSARAALIDGAGAGDNAASLVEEVESLAKQNSQNDELQSMLALAYAAKGDVDKAESLARETVARSPGSGWANYALGYCLLKKNTAPQALEPLRKAALILPREFIVRRDFTTARQGGTATAPVAVAKKSVSESEAPQTEPAAQPDWETLWKQASLAQLLNQREQFLQAGGENLRETLVAAAVFQNNLNLAEELAAPLPDDSPLRLYLAAHRKGDAQGVIKALEPWLNRKDGLSVIAQNALAYAMSSAGIRARALQVLWACRSNFPDNGVSLLNSAMVFRQAGMPKFAARTLEQLIAQYPNSQEAYTMQGVALRESGNPDEALRAAQVAYASFPQEPDIVLNLSQACLDARQPAEAEETLETALAASPNDRKLRLGLALVQIHTGKTEEALKLVEKLPPEFATGTGPDSSAIHALALAANGNWQAAEDKATSLPRGAGLPIGPVLAAACALKSNHTEAAIQQLESITDNKLPAVSWATTVMLRALGKNGGETPGPDYDALVKTLSDDRAKLADFTYGTAFLWAGLPDEAYAALARIEKAAPESTNTLLPTLYDSLSKSVR